ncbi:PAS domain-containing protein [Planctomycetota bacterium]
MVGDGRSKELAELLRAELLEMIPFNVAVIDRQFRVVAANENFEEYFGDWRGRSCHEVYQGLADPCPMCQASRTFQDGRVRVSDETGFDRHGRPSHYVVHLAPLKDKGGSVRYVIEMSTDITETKRWHREYDLLFDRVPCQIAVIDRRYRLVRINEKFRHTFGEAKGKHCYEVYKRRQRPCPRCPAQLTFEDGRERVSSQSGVAQDGSPAHYVMSTAPLSRAAGKVQHVIEIATDITEVKELQEKLQQNHDLYESLIRNSADGILAVDSDGRLLQLNAAARTLLDWAAKRRPSTARLRKMLPASFFAVSGDGAQTGEFSETHVLTTRDEKIPVRYRTVDLWSRRKRLGRAAFMHDLRELKRLEGEKLDAERLAAVGQTVAGLAHTIKNVLTGLEGGMYMVDTGLRRSDATRIVEGWDVLQRNFDKITTLVKDFLSFSKGRMPELRETDPNRVAREVVELYQEAARRRGVELVLDAAADMRHAPLDPDGMQACLTNLVSNAMDAALTRDEPGGRVYVRTVDENDSLLFEVSDNGCGMDFEVRQKCFTTFFTTKGGQGTGLGLLTTRKIVQEHGGTIEMESDPGRGSTFRIRLPRARLETLAVQEGNGDGKTGG